MKESIVLFEDGFLTVKETKGCLNAYIHNNHIFKKELLSILTIIETKFKEVLIIKENNNKMLVKAQIHIHPDNYAYIIYTDGRDNKCVSFNESSSNAIKLINDEFNKNTAV